MPDSVIFVVLMPNCYITVLIRLYGWATERPVTNNGLRMYPVAILPTE